MKNMRSKLSFLSKYPIIPIFAVLTLAMFILYLALPEKTFSDVENRSLQTMPKISASSLKDGSFMASFETYTTEQLPFREGLVKIKAFTKQLTLSNENNGIVKGKDGYLFEVSYGKSPQYGKNIAAISKFTSDLSRPVYIAIAPTAPGVIKDKLPLGYKSIDQKKELDSLKNSLSSVPNAHFINIYDSINKHAGLGEQMYYKTDHHWTTEAAYYAYSDITSAILGTGKFDINASVHTVNDFYGTHYAKYRGSSVKPDTITYYDIPVKCYVRSDGEYDSLYDFDKLKIYDKYAFFMRGNDDLSVVESENSGQGRSLLIFKDSYANCLIPYLTYDYDKITIVDLRYYSGGVEKLLEEDQNSDVLLLYNFDFINEDNHFYRLTT